MSTWALIDANNRVLEITNTNPAGVYPASMPWVSVPDGTLVGWVGTAGVFAAPPPLVTPAQAAAATLKANAMAALTASDRTVLRCYENAVAVPAAWQEYRVALRAIIGGTSTAAALPAKPAYPAGT